MNSRNIQHFSSQSPPEGSFSPQCYHVTASPSSRPHFLTWLQLPPPASLTPPSSSAQWRVEKEYNNGVRFSVSGHDFPPQLYQTKKGVEEKKKKPTNFVSGCACPPARQQKRKRKEKKKAKNQTDIARAHTKRILLLGMPVDKNEKLPLLDGLLLFVLSFSAIFNFPSHHSQINLSSFLRSERCPPSFLPFKYPISLFRSDFPPASGRLHSPPPFLPTPFHGMFVEALPTTTRTYCTPHHRKESTVVRAYKSLFSLHSLRRLGKKVRQEDVAGWKAPVNIWWSRIPLCVGSSSTVE